MHSSRDLWTSLKTPRFPVASVIKLTPTEDKLFELLDQFTQNLRKETGATIECRVAGGWVRDKVRLIPRSSKDYASAGEKLLGTESHDIDIAISSMMGAPFAEKFIPFVRSHGILAGDPHIIKQNPEQSKHLETATTTILGSDLDFVNLRNEEYSSDSRIPSSIAFGTPSEDAHRRDINFNALFYNIHDRKVEDHTGKGLDDLKCGIVRTPLPPRQTFLDDPLRVLRCVRFAARFGFKLDESIVETAKDPEIQMALSQKVARERIGIELDKMLTGFNNISAISMLHQCSLISSIFIPPGPSPFLPPKSYTIALSGPRILYALLYPGDSELPPLHDLLTKEAREDSGLRTRLFLASMLLPWRGLVYHKKARTYQAVEFVIREALKLGTRNHYQDGIPAMFEALPRLNSPAFDKFESPARVSIGLFLRDKTINDANRGLSWAPCLLFSLVQELTSLPNADDDTHRVTSKIEQYNTFSCLIEKLDLVKDVNLKPLLTGDEIRRSLGMISSGPWVGMALAKLVEWQLENPCGGKEAASEWLQLQVNEGHIQIPKKLSDVESGPQAKRPRLDKPI